MQTDCGRRCKAPPGCDLREPGGPKGQLHTPEARMTRCNKVILRTQVLGGWETHKKAYRTSGMANLVNSNAILGSMDCIYGARI